MPTYLLKAILFASLAALGDNPWWNVISEDVRLIFSIVLFLVNFIVIAAVLYLAGLVVVGKKRTLLSNAFVISLLGTVLSTVFFMFIPYRLLGLALSIIVWLLLIKRLYEINWPKAMAVGILAVIIFLVVTILLALIFGILYIILERFVFFTISIL